MSSMRVERKTDTGNGIVRLIFFIGAIALQVYFIYALMVWLNDYSTSIHLALEFVAAILVIRIYGQHTTSSMKMPWVILITTVPILGIVLWFLMGSTLATRPMRKRFQSIESILNVLLIPDEKSEEDLRTASPESASVAEYLWNRGHYPLYRNRGTVYYADTTDALNAQLEELNKAEHFIFMEYFAIEDKESFAKVHEVLKRKVQEGVEVRLFYDDVGSIGFINWGFQKKMEKDGIRTRVFNPVLPSLRVFMNNRDHRKITVIDGKVAFTGGYNLANEYFNVTHPYGEWKDAGIKITGPAVQTFTTVLLEMWNGIRATDQDDKDFGKYFPGVTIGGENDVYSEGRESGRESDAAKSSRENGARDSGGRERDRTDLRPKPRIPSESEAAARGFARETEARENDAHGERTQTAVNMLETAAEEGAIRINLEHPPVYEAHPCAEGFVQPYADSPLDEEQIGENVYMQIFNSARDYVWFITPYLILTDEMSRAINLAAERGVDVRIVTPGIPDKKITYQLTRSYYEQLVERGVKIYEFTPGFCHAKVCVSDDRIATCGTINLDYRSLYHHFEDGCVMYGSHAVMDEKADIASVIGRSREVTENYRRGKQNVVLRAFRCVLRLIAPLM